MSKSNKNRERRELVEQMRREARAAERRRTTVVVAICVVIALIIVGAAGIAIWNDHRKKEDLAKQKIADIGAAASAAGCGDVIDKEATGQGQHTADPVTYDQTPPSYGEHNPTPAPGGTHFYTADDRPPVEVLVHNLEHGWTIVWYDDTIPKDKTAWDAINKAADTLGVHGSDPKYDIIFAPWTKDDQGGGVIPDGKHVAITHWSVHMGPKWDPAVFDSTTGESKTIQSWGESQYCDTFSGAVLDNFTTQYPYDDAPEGFLWHQNG